MAWRRQRLRGAMPLGGYAIRRAVAPCHVPSRAWEAVHPHPACDSACDPACDPTCDPAGVERPPAPAGLTSLTSACPKLASSLSTTCLAPPPPPGQTVFDEEVGVADIALGAASVHLADLLKPNGNEAQRTWSGWLPLTWRPSETQDNVLLGVGAGQVGK